jgi:hypothetical protein
MNAPEIKRISLADAFKGAGTEDAAELTGLLPRRKPATQVEQPPAARPTTEKPEFAPATPAPGVTAPSAPVTPPETTAVKNPTPSMDATKDKVDNVAAYIDPVVLSAVRAARREGVPAGDPEKTYDELLVDALELVPLEKLRQVFTPEDENAEGGLMQRRKRRTRGGGGTQIQLRMNKAQEDELTALTESVGAPSRSAFVTAVYRLAYLPD